MAACPCVRGCWVVVTSLCVWVHWVMVAAGPVAVVACSGSRAGHSGSSQLQVHAFRHGLSWHQWGQMPLSVASGHWVSGAPRSLLPRRTLGILQNDTLPSHKQKQHLADLRMLAASSFPPGAPKPSTLSSHTNRQMPTHTHTHAHSLPPTVTPSHSQPYSSPAHYHLAINL